MTLKKVELLWTALILNRLILNGSDKTLDTLGNNLYFLLQLFDKTYFSVKKMQLKNKSIKP